MPKSFLLWAPALGVAGYACGFLSPEPDAPFPESPSASAIVEQSVGEQAVPSPVSEEEEGSLPRDAELRELVTELEALDADGLAARYLAIIDGRKGGDTPEKRREILLTMIRWAEIDAEHGLAFFEEHQPDPFASVEDSENQLPLGENGKYRSLMRWMQGPKAGLEPVFGEKNPEALQAIKVHALSDPRAAVQEARDAGLEPNEWGALRTRGRSFQFSEFSFQSPRLAPRKPLAKTWRGRPARRMLFPDRRTETSASGTRIWNSVLRRNTPTSNPLQRKLAKASDG